MGTRVIGLELDDTRAVAVAVDDAGHVVARAQEDGSDLVAGAAKALAQVEGAMPAASRGVVGIAAVNPESAVVAPVIAALALKLGSAKAGRPAVLSGTAAAAAEAWVGAARGMKDVVFFAVNQHTTGGVVRDGVAITGARGRAGLVGWLALNPVEREDYRKTGCLEAEVAAAGIVPPHRLAHQGGRSIAGAGHRQGRLFRDHHGARARRRARRRWRFDFRGS